MSERMTDPAPLEAAAFTALGTERERVSLPTTPFDGVVNEPVMHQAVKAYLANQRQGTAYTRTRGLVTGGNQKPWRQKGTGRARQGSTRAPHWPGGGTVFGPHGDRNYQERVPRQVRALARRSALNARALSGDVVLVDGFTYDEPKTARLRAALERIGVSERKVLILTDGAKAPVHLSARNLPNVHVLPYSDVSTYHVLWSDVVLIESSAIGQTLEPIAESGDAPAPARKRAASKRAAAADVEADADVSGESASPPRRKKAATKTRAKRASSAVKRPAAKKKTAKKAAKKRSAPGKKGK
jgi:large subunit ribosomal protein L4